MNRTDFKNIWRAEDLIEIYPKIFPTAAAVRYAKYERGLKAIQLGTRGKTFYRPEDVEAWMQNNIK